MGKEKQFKDYLKLTVFNILGEIVLSQAEITSTKSNSRINTKHLPHTPKNNFHAPQTSRSNFKLNTLNHPPWSDIINSLSNFYALPHTRNSPPPR